MALDGRIYGAIGVMGVAGGLLALGLRGDARIVSVSLSHQERYDRLVLQLSRSVDIVRRPETQWSDLIVDLDAVPRERRSEIPGSSERVGTVTIEQTPGGARLSSARRDRRLRLFRLEDPPRLVVDFADADNMLLSKPGGSWAIPTSSPGGPELAYSSAARPFLEREDREPRQTDPAEPGRAEEPRPSSGIGLRVLLALGLGVGLLALAALGAHRGLEVWTRLRRADRSARWMAPALPAARRIEPPLEPTRLSDGEPRSSTELLARRHDEEVSARMQLEERVLQLQEEVRQLRDGLIRLARRSEDRP